MITPEEFDFNLFEDGKFGRHVIIHGDCREVLEKIPQVDLLLTDPPYGINENSYRVANRSKLAKTKDYGVFHWDKKRVNLELLKETISKAPYQIIWGGNYYIDILSPTSCFLVWDKMGPDNDYADCELAWTNFPCATRIKHHLWNGMIRKGREFRVHPTQKPLDVITWCLTVANKFITKNKEIKDCIVLDPLAGSCTTAVAAKNIGCKSICIEQEEKYCKYGEERLAQEVLF
jgi:DNA modification methylase